PYQLVGRRRARLRHPFPAELPRSEAACALHRREDAPPRHARARRPSARGWLWRAQGLAWRDAVLPPGEPCHRHGLWPAGGSAGVDDQVADLPIAQRQRPLDRRLGRGAAAAREQGGAGRMIRLHDTLAREKREFVPADPKRITMYVCGPTVYGRAHIGNARPAVVFDTLARLIRREFGPHSLKYARNVTDVDDKIIASAQAEGVDPSVITARYERHYLEDMGALGVTPPDIAPHATQEIGPMIAMIERLIELGNAYEAQGHVL